MKAYLTSSFLPVGLIDPDRSVAYQTTHVLGHRLILERGRQKFLVRGLRGPLPCDEACALSLSWVILVPSWNRGLVCGRSFREPQLHPCGVIFLVPQQTLGTRRLQIYGVQLLLLQFLDVELICRN
jgi:hypothetical protein